MRIQSMGWACLAVAAAAGCASTGTVEREQTLKGDGTYDFPIPGSADSLFVVNEYEVVADAHRADAEQGKFEELSIRHNGRGDIFDVIEQSNVSAEEHYAHRVHLDVGSALERTFYGVVPVGKRKAQGEREDKRKGSNGAELSPEVLALAARVAQQSAQKCVERASRNPDFSVDAFLRKVLLRKKKSEGEPEADASGATGAPAAKSDATDKKDLKEEREARINAYFEEMPKEERSALVNLAIAARVQINGDEITGGMPSSGFKLHEYQVRTPFDSTTIQASTIYAPVDSALYVGSYVSFFPLTGWDVSERGAAWWDRFSFDAGLAVQGVGERAQQYLDDSKYDIMMGVGFRVHEKFSICAGDLMHIPEGKGDRIDHRAYAGVSIDLLKIIDTISSSK